MWHAQKKIFKKKSDDARQGSQQNWYFTWLIQAMHFIDQRKVTFLLVKARFMRFVNTEGFKLILS